MAIDGAVNTMLICFLLGSGRGTSVHIHVINTDRRARYPRLVDGARGRVRVDVEHPGAGEGKNALHGSGEI